MSKITAISKNGKSKDKDSKSKVAMIKPEIMEVFRKTLQSKNILGCLKCGCPDEDLQPHLVQISSFNQKLDCVIGICAFCGAVTTYQLRVLMELSKKEAQRIIMPGEGIGMRK